MIFKILLLVIFALVFFTGLLLGPSETENCLSITGLCYEEDDPTCAKQLLETIISVKRNDFSDFDLCTEFSADNSDIQQIASQAGFIQCSHGSLDNMWVRFIWAPENVRLYIFYVFKFVT